MQHNRALNQLLINIARNLVQYVGEAWPWTSHDSADDRAAFMRLAERQQVQVAALSDLLTGRNWPVEYGSYPTEFTDLHFISLNYLLVQMVQDTEWLVQRIEATLAECSDDEGATPLLRDILADTHGILIELRSMQQRHGAKAHEVRTA